MSLQLSQNLQFVGALWKAQIMAMAVIQGDYDFGLSDTLDYLSSGLSAMGP